MAEVRDMNEDLLVTMLVGIAAVIAVTYAIYRSVIRPIELLDAAVQGVVNGGDLPIPAVRGPSEVVSLSKHFSALAEEVRTELQRTQAAETTYRAIFDSNPQPAWVHDRASGALLAVNRAMECLYGISRDELLCMRMQDLLSEATSARLGPLLDAGDHIERSGPWLLIGRDGEPIDCLITSTVLDRQGRPGQLVIAEDVTAHRRSQLLNHSQRMESLGQLAGGIAHDFNNLLAVILNYAEFVGEEIERATHEDPQRWTPVLRDTEQIGDAGRRAAELTEQLLSFAQAEFTNAGPVGPQ